MSKEMLLLMYSEWLDADMHLIKEPDESDQRTHSDLVDAFLDYLKEEGY